jgi:hypothetical protein
MFDYKKLIYVNFPPISTITDKTLKLIQNQYIRKLWTDDEYEKYRQKVLNTSLP